MPDQKQELDRRQARGSQNAPGKTTLPGKPVSPEDKNRKGEAFKANKKPRTFRNSRDLRAAVMRGEVGFNDPVELLE